VTAERRMLRQCPQMSQVRSPVKSQQKPRVFNRKPWKPISMIRNLRKWSTTDISSINYRVSDQIKLKNDLHSQCLACLIENFSNEMQGKLSLLVLLLIGALGSWPEDPVKLLAWIYLLSYILI